MWVLHSLLVITGQQLIVYLVVDIVGRLESQIATVPGL